MDCHNAQLAKAAVATAGVLGGAYIAYRLFKTKSRPVRQVVIPEKWTHIGKLTDIYIYPIKSCGPVRMESAECAVLGLRDGWLRDRVLMIVDSKNNFISARGYPQLLQVKTSVQGSVLTLKHKDMEPCSVNLAEVAAIGKPLKATVWDVTVPVLACGFETCEWISRLLDKSSYNFQLVLYATEKPRNIRGTYAIRDNAANKFLDSDLSAFADEVSYNLINEASIEDLNSRLEEKVTHRNFRPNLVIKGPKAFDEDNWDFIKIGETIFEIIKPCGRCIMTTMDPETGIRNVNSEPLKTLKSYRMLEDPELIRLMGGTSPRMGLQMALRSTPGGIISLEDEVSVAYASS